MTARMVTIDCADPVALTKFWSEAAGYRLTRLGARMIAEHSAPGFTWTVLADPEGNEFCISAAE